MSTPHMSRRDVLLQGSMAIAGLALLRVPRLAYAFSIQPGEEVLPWLDQPAPNPVPEVVGIQLQWENLDNWVTPNDQFFTVGHYDKPVLDAATWRLQIGGLVQQPMVLTLDDLKARPRQEVTFTLECSGNQRTAVFLGWHWQRQLGRHAVGAAAPGGGRPGPGYRGRLLRQRHGCGGVREIKMPQHFARSMALADAMDPHNLLCYEMNGEPLPQAHGFPVRLIAPGWYGIANVKWLQRIEVLRDSLPESLHGARLRDDSRAAARRADGMDRNVGRPRVAQVGAGQSHPANGQYRIVGAAWGAPIARVEVQIDSGPWLPASDRRGRGRRVCLEAVVTGLGQSVVGRARHHLSGDRHRWAHPAGARTTPGSRGSTPTGRATGRSPAASPSPERPRTLVRLNV